MTKTTLNRALQTIAACALLGMGSTGWAASTAWDLSSGCSSITNSTGSSGVVDCGKGVIAGTTTAGTIAVTAQAYSTSTASGTSFATASLYNYGSSSGLGVTNAGGADTGTPSHTTDNKDGTDLIVLNFTTAVNLTNVTIGWWSSDYDITVLAYTGTGTPTISGKTLAGTDAASLVGSGWTSVKSYGSSNTTAAAVDTATDVSLNTTLDTTTYSSWWIISAYNAGYGAGSTAMDAMADYVKILSIAGSTKSSTTTKVPEPGSLALMGAGLLGLLASRRKAKGNTVDLAA